MEMLPVSARRCSRPSSKSPRRCDTSWVATSRPWCTPLSAYARMKNRLQTYAVSTSVGPGATNMLTGAALATINRLPVLLLPADTFADRSASPLLQELELPDSGDVTVNDAFRPVSRYFDRIWRPEQLPAALLSAMRVLTDPAETGTVTLCFPQDVQAEAYDWPTDLFDKRVWHVARPATGAIYPRGRSRDHQIG